MPKTTSTKGLFVPMGQIPESLVPEKRVKFSDLPEWDYSNDISDFPCQPIFDHDEIFLHRLQDHTVASQTVSDLQQIYNEEFALPVGFRLRHFWPRWAALGASSYHVAKIQFGITLHWRDEHPPLSITPLIWSDTSNDHHSSLIEEAIATMISKQAITQIFDNSEGFYSRLFMVPKRGTSKWRPVIDLSTLNKYIIIPKFKMETAELIRDSLQQHEWTTSIDLQDAYFHAPLNAKFRKYFRFAFKGKCYEFQADPFGLATAPLEFTQVAKEFKQIAMVHGFRINQYLDDWLDRCLSQPQGRLSIIKLLHLLLYLGFLPNLAKCSLEPAQEFDYLGMHYMLQHGQVRPTEKHIEILVKVTDSFIQSETKSARQFMSIIGILNATFRQVHQVGRLHIRPLQWQLRRNWKQGDSLSKQIQVPHSLTCHLHWWGCKSILFHGTSLHPDRDEVLVFTDSSTTGWGAHCQGQELQGDWCPSQLLEHINILELRAVLLAIRKFAPLLKNKVVLVLCDNSVAVSHLERGGGIHSWKLYSLSWLIFSLTSKLAITLHVRHIPGSLNVIADRLSRKDQVMQTEWSLHPQVFRSVCKTYFTPLIDAFATSDNTKLPLYISPVPDDKAYAVDAISFKWSNLSIYMFPPTMLLSKVLRKLTAEPRQVLLIAPFWPSQLWFWDLVHLSTDRPCALPDMPKLLKQPGSGGVFDKNYRMRHLHVWPINSFMDHDPEFCPSTWLQGFRKRKSTPPAVFARQNGFSGSFNETLAFWLDTGFIS